MEDDRAQVDLGIAADIEEAQMAQAEQPQAAEASHNGEQPSVRQPRKRFVGRRAATEAAAAAAAGSNVSAEQSGAVQGK
jgi:2-(3-amino-3-carboxypropyl)histidine synthase